MPQWDSNGNRIVPGAAKLRQRQELVMDALGVDPGTAGEAILPALDGPENLRQAELMHMNNGLLISAKARIRNQVKLMKESAGGDVPESDHVLTKYDCFHQNFIIHPKTLITMVYKYFEHQADVGIIGVGKTLEEAFQEGAKAMFQIMCDVDKVKPKKTIKIKLKSNDEESLFVDWLNELLAKKDIEEMMFSEFKVKIKGTSLTADVKGEKLDLKKHHLKIEVKAATYSQLKIEKGKEYKAQCVVDV